MSFDPLVTTPATTSPTRTVVVRRKRRGPRFWIALAGAMVLIGAVVARARENGFQIQDLWRERPVPLALFEVDEGRLEVSVTETGTIESAVNSKIKCQVEALLGNVTASSASSGTSGTTGSRTSGSSQPTQTVTATKAKTSARTKAGAAAGTGAATGASASSAGASTASTAAAAGGSAVGKKPTIRSFSYVVAKHVPLRGTAVRAVATPTAASASSAGGGGGGGRGGRGGGGGGGGGGRSSSTNGAPEVQGSTRIIEILPEGTAVKTGEIVCSLDSSNFRDEYQAQQIKYAQAKAWVDQAKAILEVNEITFREYRDGIYPQDLMLIKQYIKTCEVEYERAVKTEEWSKDTLKKGFRASAQYSADQIELQRAEMALKEARSMEGRLVQYRAPMLLKSLEAKLQSIRADMLAQEASFGIEDDRLRRLKKMIDNCTIRAPREGIVVYANESNPWSGRTEVQIQEGATVREGQPLFDLPDPNLMRVKVKINESKMASIRAGQKAVIQIEAFPEKPLTGIVTEITPIPAILGRFSDIRIYYAYVKLDTGGFTGLRPGMSAEVSFFVEAQPKVTRIPVESVRWVGEKPFAAVASRVGDETNWEWRPIQVGLMNENYAQVVKGLKAGEHVVANPDELPAPTVPKAPAAVQTAGTQPEPTRG